MKVDYVLTPRHEMLFTHRVDIWKNGIVYDADGRAHSGGYVKVEEDVPCYIDMTPNLDVPTMAGRVRSDMLYTIDHIHLPEHCNVEPDWYMVNKSLDRDGNPVEVWGSVWRVRGEPQEFSTQGRRNAGKKVVMANPEPKMRCTEDDTLVMEETAQ